MKIRHPVTVARDRLAMCFAEVGATALHPYITPCDKCGRDHVLVHVVGRRATDDDRALLLQAVKVVWPDRKSWIVLKPTDPCQCLRKYIYDDEAEEAA